MILYFWRVWSLTEYFHTVVLLDLLWYKFWAQIQIEPFINKYTFSSPNERHWCLGGIRGSFEGFLYFPLYFLVCTLHFSTHTGPSVTLKGVKYSGLHSGLFSVIIPDIYQRLTIDSLAVCEVKMCWWGSCVDHRIQNTYCNAAHVSKYIYIYKYTPTTCHLSYLTCPWALSNHYLSCLQAYQNHRWLFEWKHALN